MKLTELLFEYNVYNVKDLDQQVTNIAHEIPDPAVASRLVKVVRRLAINSLDWLRPITQAPANSPEWAQKAASAGDLYQFVMTPELRAQLTELSHYLVALVQDRDQKPTESDPDFNFKNQKHLDAVSTLNNLEKIQYSDLLRKMGEYYARGSRRAVKDDAGTHTVLETGGYRWVELDNQDAFKREGSVLQNCIGRHYTYAGTQKSGEKILVLKDPTNASHVATRIHGKVIQEIKGKQNKPPAEKYMPASNDLIQHFGLKLSSTSAQDFSGAGYVMAPNNTLQHWKQVYPPESVGEFDGYQITKWSAPLTIWRNTWGDGSSLWDMAESAQRYDVFRGSNVVLSLAVEKKQGRGTSNQLAGLSNISDRVSPNELVKLIDHVMALAGVSQIKMGVVVGASEHGIWEKNGKIVTMDEAITRVPLMQVPAGQWVWYQVPVGVPSDSYDSIFGLNKSDYFARDVIGLEGTGPSLNQQFNVVASSGYYGGGPTSSIGGLNLRDYSKIQDYDMNWLNENLMPLVKKFNLQLDVNGPFLRSGDQLMTFEQAYPQKLIVETPKYRYYEVPPEAVRKGFLSKLALYGRAPSAGWDRLFIRRRIGDEPDPTNDHNYLIWVRDDLLAITMGNDALDQSFITAAGIKGIDYNIPENRHGFRQWTIYQGQIVNLKKLLTQDLALAVKDEYRIYRVDGDRVPFMPALFHTVYKNADAYYIVVPWGAGQWDKRGYIAVSQGKVVGTTKSDKPAMIKLAKEYHAQLGFATPGAKVEAGKGRTISPGSNFHEMLKYVAANPGQPRSGWYVKHLGLSAQGMPGWTSKTSPDGEAARKGLITDHDPGKREGTYQLRITPWGQQILDRFNAGEKVPVTDLDQPR